VDLWRTYGGFMEDLWWIDGFMEDLWIYEQFMEDVLMINGRFMEDLWRLYR